MSTYQIQAGGTATDVAKGIAKSFLSLGIGGVVAGIVLAILLIFAIIPLAMMEDVISTHYETNKKNFLGFIPLEKFTWISKMWLWVLAVPSAILGLAILIMVTVAAFGGMSGETRVE